MLTLVLVVCLLCLCFGAFPAWPHSQNWGYGPSGGLGFVLIVLLIWMVLFHGRL